MERDFLLTYMCAVEFIISVCIIALWARVRVNGCVKCSAEEHKQECKKDAGGIAEKGQGHREASEKTEEATNKEAHARDRQRWWI